MNTIQLAGPVTPGDPGASIGNPALGDTLEGILENEGGIGYFGRLLPTVVGLILVGGSVAFAIYMLWGGFEYITSGGDKQSLQNAQGKIRNALVGIVVMLSAFAIIRLIEDVFSINILTIDIGPLIIR